MDKLKVLELFAGIGACSSALDRLGIEYEIVDAVDNDKYAIKSFNAIHNTNFEPQDITTWDKDLEVDLIMHGSPCLTKESLILTNKGYIPLGEVSIGDLVLTKSNTWHKVNKIFDNGVKDTIYLHGMGFENIHCTPEHKFYVRTYKRIWENTTRTYKRVFSEPDFVEASNITKKHYLGVPVIQEEVPFFTDDLEFWYLVGLYLGDGWLKSGKGYDIVFGLNDNKIERLKSNVKEENWKWSIYSERTTKKLRFVNKKLYEFIDKYIGTGSFNKHIPYEILCLPKEQLQKVYQGYLDSDGCNIKNTDKYQFSSVNRNLVYSMSLIINKLFNRPTQITLVKVKPKKRIENRIVNQHDWYLLRFHMNQSKQDHAFYENGYIWYPFTKIESAEKENVYNMEIDVDHSYIVQGCISKNCQDFSVAGKQAGGDEGSGTRSSLMYETIRIVEKLKPKYVVWENVKNLISKKHKHNFDAYIETMDELGYASYYKVLNAKDYGIPQNRERVYTVSIRKDLADSFKFPDEKELELMPKDMLEDNVDEKYYLDEDGLKNYNREFGSKGKQLSLFEPVPTLTASMGTGGGNIPYFEFPPKQELKLKLKDMLDSEVDEKYFLSDKIVNKIINSNFNQERTRIQGTDVCDTLLARDYKDPKCVEVNRMYGIFDTDGSTHQAGSVYDEEGLSPTLDTMQGGYRQPCVEVRDDKNYIDIITPVKVRKYPVDTENLKKLLRWSKDKTNKEIAEALDVPVTTVEHYFRTDDCFAIPDPEVWPKLKEVLGIKTDEFDKSIMTFEERDGVYDKANRCYKEDGIAPTLTSASADEKVLVKDTIKKIINDNAKHQQDLVQTDEGVCRCIPAGTHGSTPHLLKTIVGGDTSFIEEKYKDFVEENGYIPEMFNPYNKQEIKDVAPTQTTQCGSTTSSATVLKTEDEKCIDAQRVPLKFLNRNQKNIDGDYAFCVDSCNTGGVKEVYKSGYRIRKLTPKECWRLMSFTDEEFNKAAEVNSNSQLYKQAGNSIVVSVLVEIFKILLKEYIDYLKEKKEKEKQTNGNKEENKDEIKN